MAVTPGDRLGSFEVLSTLGAGGMGEVYRARDTRLNREVALKVLPDAFAADSERLGRFEREAQTLASLNHPHIAAIYGLEDGGTGSARTRALVLELIPGLTLAELMARGPLPADEAVRIARQIAEALEAAHEQGIVHRDLKPANVKITPNGTVKVLDFGLAKLTAVNPEPVSGSHVPLSMTPTIASPTVMTGATVLLGTAAYMAPEQARGKPVDRRADIWAFGVVLYEMLSGTRAFQGDSVTEVVGAVIHKDPDLAALPPLPPVVRMVVERCLQKDPRQRFRDMGDVLLALDGAFSTATAVPPAPAAPPRRRTILAVAALLIGALAGALSVWTLMRERPVEATLLRFDVPPPAPRAGTPILEISPDGRTLAFVALDSSNAPRLWIRPLDSAESRILTPRDEIRQPIMWSPDSRQIAYFADGALRRVAIDGGPPETIAKVTTYFGGAWGSDGTILFGSPTGLVRVPVSGGEPTTVTSTQAGGAQGAHMLPRFLPDGRRFLYFRPGNAEQSGLYAGSLDVTAEEQSRQRILASGSAALYVPSPDGSDGYLLFVRERLLTAQRFDPATLTLSGEAAALLQDPIDVVSVLPAISASHTGTLVYRKGGEAAARHASALDRAGKATPVLDGTLLQGPNYPRISPDGRRVALVLDGQLWSYPIAGGAPTKLTYDGQHYSSVWTRDGQRLVMEKNANDAGQTLFSVAADGSSAAVQPIGPIGHFHPHGWAADGDLVATRLIDGGVEMDLVRFRLTAGTQPRDVVATPVPEGATAAVSPDGRWLAYESPTTGRSEIWVTSLSSSGPPIRVSSNGGNQPAWSKDGRELFYVENGKVMSVAVDTRSGFNFKIPVMLFTAESVAGAVAYDTMADGRLFAFTSEAAPDFPLSVIVNWPNLLAARERPH